MANADELKRSIDRLNAELTRIESVPDPALMPVETVLFWEKTYPATFVRRAAWDQPGAVGMTEDTAYKFVALKVSPNVWYTTSVRDGQMIVDDDELRDTLAGQHISNRYIVDVWLALEEYVPASPFESA